VIVLVNDLGGRCTGNYRAECAVVHESCNLAPIPERSARLAVRLDVCEHAPVSNNRGSLSTRSHKLSRWLLVRPGLFVATVVFVLLFPFLVVVAAVVDVGFRRWRFGTVRILAFALWYLLGAVLVQVLAFGIWLSAPFAGGRDSPASRVRNLALISFWIRLMLRGLRLTVNLRIEADHPEAARGGAVIATRHQSLADVFLPTGIAIGEGSTLRVVLAAGLRREPSLDLFGSRTPQYFLERRSSNMDSELAAISNLAAGSGTETALVIWPEGALVREERRTKVIAALDRRDPEQAERARALRHLLPAKVAGLSALLDGAPEADVVIVGHVGYEQLTDPATIWSCVPLERPIVVTLRRYPRVEIPSGREERKQWLNDRWDEMDDWVERNVSGHSEHEVIGKGRN